jgi:hypothetical protein
MAGLGVWRQAATEIGLRQTESKSREGSVTEGWANNKTTLATYRGRGHLVPYLDALVVLLRGSGIGLIFVVGLLGIDDKWGQQRLHHKVTL